MCTNVILKQLTKILRGSVKDITHASNLGVYIFVHFPFIKLKNITI